MRKRKQYPVKVEPPPGGWSPRTYYLVAVQCRRDNPTWTAIFYSGFLTPVKHVCKKPYRSSYESALPGSYNGIMQVLGGDYYPLTYRDLYRIVVLKELFTRESMDSLNPHLYECNV